ncbi:MAG: radical SAM family heme chaperone HemW [Erysipelotrichaceae bacterium]
MNKGLYLHIPFCHSICHYCDFTRCIYSEQLANQYIDKLVRDIDQLDDDFITCYIGGGTPSCLTTKQLTTLLKSLQRFNFKEFTIEANPNDIDFELVKLLVSHKINRISLGVQSLDDQLLKDINRNHSVKQVYQAIDILNSNGLNNISIDLIYGFKQQSLALWEDTLIKSLNLDVQHLSIYALTIEENSYFKRHNIESVDDDTSYLMYQKAVEILSSKFEHYEISNFAFNNHYSFHNMLYWKDDNYIALGLGASGKMNNIRKTYSTNFIDYLNDNAYEIEENTIDEMKFEYIMTNLRLVKGLDINEYFNRFNSDIFLDYAVIKKLIDDNQLVYIDNYLKIREDLLFVSNSILVSFL